MNEDYDRLKAGIFGIRSREKIDKEIGPNGDIGKKQNYERKNLATFSLEIYKQIGKMTT